MKIWSGAFWGVSLSGFKLSLIYDFFIMANQLTLVVKKTVSISEFKSKSHFYVRDVDENGIHIIITKHRKPIAEVQPIIKLKTGSNPLKDSVLLEKDIVSPIDTDWEVLED